MLHITRISIPRNYSGWIFAIEKPGIHEQDYYKVNAKGVVYITKQTLYKHSIKFRLYDSRREDISFHVKLFQISDHTKRGETENLEFIYCTIPPLRNWKSPRKSGMT